MRGGIIIKVRRFVVAVAYVSIYASHRLANLHNKVSRLARNAPTRERRERGFAGRQRQYLIGIISDIKIDIPRKIPGTNRVCTQLKLDTLVLCFTHILKLCWIT